MGRKHQNRRGKVGRRARARKATNSETAEQILGLCGGKFDAPPKVGDDSVLSSKKINKHAALETPDEPIAVPVKAAISGSRLRHEEMKKHGQLRKKLIAKASVVSKSSMKLPVAVSSADTTARSVGTAARSAATTARSPATTARSSATASRSATTAARSSATAARSAATAARSAATAARSPATPAPSATTPAPSATTAAPSAATGVVFGELAHAPSAKIAKLGKLMANKKFR